ncbi:MAG: hypothetical protein ACFFCZ_27420 [Promethearchaeota archaeon]
MWSDNAIIDKLNSRNVIAIDQSYKELEETENESRKILMDATDLKFLALSFEVAMSFSLSCILTEKCR